MMHHPNMHHQPVSGHPPQHMPGHQGIPTHHQIPPPQMHRENRHVTLARVPVGHHGQAGGMGGPGGGMGGMGTLGMRHHAPSHRPPHPIRAMQHHPIPQHHSVPPQMKAVRRGYADYGPRPGCILGARYTQHPRLQTDLSAHHTGISPMSISNMSTPLTAGDINDASNKGAGDGAGMEEQSHAACPSATVKAVVTSGVCSTGDNTTVVSGNATATVGGSNTGVEEPESAAGGAEAARPVASAQANSKEKTPMCLVNELARYNKIKHQYRLTSETGPAHKKVFTVTLRLGDTEEYTAEGSSIKRAQHAAASAALCGTRFPAPPPRASLSHASHHVHLKHAGAVMPTVELNALAMKLCQPAVYTSICPVATAPRLPRVRPPPPYRMHPPYVAYQRVMTPGLVYRVRVTVGGKSWLGEGSTPQAARHDAAARALQELRPPEHMQPLSPIVAEGQTDADGEVSEDLLNEVKSPVSLVHELALKRNLTVQFTVKSERGPPHMRVFVTLCTVGDMETEGEGNGKKVSKRRAAEHMLEEMRQRWPPALLRARPQYDKRRPQTAKKKPRNLIKEGDTSRVEPENSADNPISRLAMARHAVRARSPQYRVLEERGVARRREFLVQCDAPPHCATGVGPNKKTAKRRAAHNVLLAMEMVNTVDNCALSMPNNDITPINGNNESAKNNVNIKRKEGDSENCNNGNNGEPRQPVPGVLLMDFHQQPPTSTSPANSVKEPSSAGNNISSGGNTPGAKDQLMYLSQLLGFTVQFSDFPKRNHGEYLSLVSLTTNPPVMCHGGGPSTAHSHEQCARAALRALALMGLDAPESAPLTPGAQSMECANNKPNTISNGLSE